jgi:putative Holliday junction resolvase
MSRVLGIDLGDARTGLALSDELRLLAHPLETIPTQSADALAQRVQRIVTEKNVDAVVIGLPRHMNGTFGEAAQAAEKFAAHLRGVLCCPVLTWDERLSTVAAERALRAAGKKSHQTRGIRDQVAAQIVLQSYLDRLNA